MNVSFENNFQKKVMHITFPEPVTIATGSDVLEWRKLWTDALKSWHSPYKALIDCTNLTVGNDPDIPKQFERMEKFLKGFFLKSAMGFGYDPAKGHDALFFSVKESEEEASDAVGLGRVRVAATPGDFRSSIQLQNHFQQHVMELNFAQPVVIDSVEQWAVMRGKIMNNLMQWHSKWSLLIDCSNLEFAKDFSDEYAKFQRYLQGFFMKKVIGYSPKGPKESYPFEVFRARHNAAARLEAEGNFSGDTADCRSRKG